MTGFDTITIPIKNLPQGRNCWHCEQLYFIGHKDFPPYRYGCDRNGNFDAEKCKYFKAKGEKVSNL